MTRAPSPVLLFDLDGTLTDPKPGLVASIRYALERLGRPCPADDALVACIGPPLRETFARLLATTDAAHVEDALGLYRERYGAGALFENAVYDGIPGVLDALAAVTARRFVATAKPAVFAARIVAHFGLDRHFARVYGPELDGRLDDKVELVAHLLEQERVAAAQAVMIGDRDHDVRAGRANGLRTIGVLWGYGSAGELAAAGADALCATPADLPRCVSRVLAV